MAGTLHYKKVVTPSRMKRLPKARKTGTEFDRGYVSQEHGLKGGFKYLEQEQVTALRLKEAYRRSIDQSFVDYVLDPRTGVPHELNFMKVSAAARNVANKAALRVENGNKAVALIVGALAHRKIGSAQLNKLRRAYPSQVDNIEALRITDDDWLAAAKEIVEVKGKGLKV